MGTPTGPSRKNGTGALVAVCLKNPRRLGLARMAWSRSRRLLFDDQLTDGPRVLGADVLGLACHLAA